MIHVKMRILFEMLADHGLLIYNLLDELSQAGLLQVKSRRRAMLRGAEQLLKAESLKLIALEIRLVQSSSGDSEVSMPIYLHLDILFLRYICKRLCNKLHEFGA